MFRYVNWIRLRPSVPVVVSPTLRNGAIERGVCRSESHVNMKQIIDGVDVSLGVE